MLMPVSNPDLADDAVVEPDAALFRQAFRRGAGGVCVVTVAHAAQRSGLTVTSVVSLSPEPAELMVAVNPGSSSFPLLLGSRRFGVNLLSARQQAVAERFSGIGDCRGEQRYAGAGWRCTESGAWLLDKALVAMDCAVQDIWVRPGHAVVIGRIDGMRFAPPGGVPLVYSQGRYGVAQLT